MNFREMLLKRESCRSFDPQRRPSKEQLMEITELAGLSPSACNTQPWRYVIVNDPGLAPKLAECTQSFKMNKFASDCPAFIVVCEEPPVFAKKTRDKFVKYRYSEIDIGISTMNLCYAALELGLSTCILGWFNERKIKKLLKLGVRRRVKLVICVGYAKNDKIRNKKRMTSDEITDYIG